MAARSKAYRSRLFIFLLLITLVSTFALATSDDPTGGSVKKELRNPNRWTGSGLSEEEEVEPIRGLYLDEGSQMLASFLHKVGNEELGVSAMQTIYDGLQFASTERDDAGRARDLRDRLQRKLAHYASLINMSRTTIEDLFWHHLHRPLSTPAPCCELPDSLLRYDSHFGAPVSEELACDVSTPSLKPLSFIPGHNLTDVFANNLKLSPSVKWQYFLGADGGLSEYPAHKSGCGMTGGGVVAAAAATGNHRRDLYLSAVHPEPVNVVIVVDHGSALSPNQLSLAKAVAKYVLSGLSDKDHVGLVALADEAHFPGTGDCFTKGLIRATRANKLRFSAFIDSLTKAKAPANHSLGFRQALEMARRAALMSEIGSTGSRNTADCSTGGQNENCNNAQQHWPPSVGDCPSSTTSPVLVSYISRGLLSSLAEPRQVLELIALGQLCLQGRLVINTYALIDDGKPIMYEKAFLSDLATQNYSRYNVSFAALERLPILAGQALAINSSRWLSASVGDYLAVLRGGGVNGTASSMPPLSPSLGQSSPASPPSSAGQQGHQQLAYSPPYWDPVGKGMVVSLTQPCYHLDLLVGAVGLDVHLADLVEDFTYFNHPGGRSYSFLMDSTGTVMMHPALARPNHLPDEPVATDIELLESPTSGGKMSSAAFSVIRRRMLSASSGSERLPVMWDNEEDLDESSEDDDEEDGAGQGKRKNMTVSYTWERAGPFVVVVVSRLSNRPDGRGPGSVQILRRIQPSSGPPDLVYHRLDVVSSPARVDLCRYFRWHSTLSAGSLFLSPASHLASFQFESWAGEPSPGLIQSFMAYLGDRTKLIANPGLRPMVRTDVSALTQLVPYWKSQFGHSPLSQFVIRRYAATPSGVLIEYPSTIRAAWHDPLRRPWYRKALEFPGRVVVTGPSLDPSGAGYVVSISHTVYEGRPSGQHGPWDDVMAVLGADLTLSYLHRTLWETLRFCPDRAAQVAGTSVRCFLMDERGYLLAHPNLLDAQSGPPGGVELQHLTHHEPLVASDLLNHDRFVTKKACSSWPDLTVQRYYELNMTLSDRWGTLDPAGTTSAGNGGSGARPMDSPPMPVLTNLVHGEHCIRYQIVAVQGTNLFVGIVNQTCESATAFCPCSTVDRLCLNCHRMEQSECECPCECPLETDACTSHQSTESSLPACPAIPEPINPFGGMMPPVARPDGVSQSANPPVDVLPACLAPECSERMTEHECFGVVGCEWCVRDGLSVLAVPFCTQHSKCYGGQLRGPSPYTDESGAGGNGILSASDSGSFMKALPVGPVAGGVMAFFAFVALSIYCYRRASRKRRRNGQCGYESAAGGAAGMRMTPLDGGHDHDDGDDMEPDADETTAVVSHEFSLANSPGLDNVAIVSPYRVNTGYRRPAGGDSDHGYSTAGYSYSTSTPHDDSENAPSFVEPLLVGRDRYRPSAVRSSASVASFSSRASSPLGPVSSRRLAAAACMESPAGTTLHESADELEESSKWAACTSRLPPHVKRLDDVQGMTTILPDNNQMVVPVTVHMVDTA